MESSPDPLRDPPQEVSEREPPSLASPALAPGDDGTVTREPGEAGSAPRRSIRGDMGVPRPTIRLSLTLFFLGSLRVTQTHLPPKQHRGRPGACRFASLPPPPIRSVTYDVNGFVLVVSCLLWEETVGAEEGRLCTSWVLWLRTRGEKSGSSGPPSCVPQVCN